MLQAFDPHAQAIVHVFYDHRFSVRVFLEKTHVKLVKSSDVEGERLLRGQLPHFLQKGQRRDRLLAISNPVLPDRISASTIQS